MNNRIILGTVQFGINYGINNPEGKPSEDKVFKIIDKAIELGISIFDTADAYGNASEIIGKYNRTHVKSLDINTKFKGNSTKLRKQLDDSLNLLHVNEVNVYFYHSFQDFIDHPDLQVQLLELKARGKIKKIGLSVYDNFELETACRSSLIDVIQFPLNLLDNLHQRGDQIKLAKKMGKELQVRSVFLQGLFFKPLNDFPAKLEPLVPYIRQIRDISKTNKVSLEELTLGYALHCNEIDHIIIGIDSEKQLIDNVNKSKCKISNTLFDAVNQIKVKEVDLLYPKNW
jgi:uncharacterized protein